MTLDMPQICYLFMQTSLDKQGGIYLYPPTSVGFYIKGHHLSSLFS